MKQKPISKKEFEDFHKLLQDEESFNFTTGLFFPKVHKKRRIFCVTRLSIVVEELLKGFKNCEVILSKQLITLYPPDLTQFIKETPLLISNYDALLSFDFLYDRHSNTSVNIYSPLFASFIFDFYDNHLTLQNLKVDRKMLEYAHKWGKQDNRFTRLLESGLDKQKQDYKN